MEIQGIPINKLVVAGCSFSDRFHVEKNYCDYLSLKLKIKGEHFAAHCGSNPRIWRLILSGIRNKTINKNTLLIIQYTDVVRKEFWSRFYDPEMNRIKDWSGSSPLREEFDGGDLIKYKFDAYNWQHHQKEKSLFKNLEENFTNELYENETFKNYHYSFLNTLENNQINAIFIKSYYINGHGLLDDTQNFQYPKIFDLVSDKFPYSKKDNCLNVDDCAHLSKKGHINLSNMLFDYINNMYNK